MISEIREWVMLAFEGYICYILTMEYFYDKQKDEKRQRKTRTTKKTTTLQSGEIVTEENTESVESKEGTNGNN